MNTKVIFNVDKKIKDRTIEKEKFNPKTRRRIKGAVRDIKEKKNLSPRFSSAKEAIKYLKG